MGKPKALDVILDESVDLDVTTIVFDIDETEWTAKFDGLHITLECGDLEEVTLAFRDGDKWIDVAKRMVRGLSWALRSDP